MTTQQMNLPARVWTAAVAYVALAIGAGLSIAGNVADTFRTRGVRVDGLDIVMAVAWPALVVLMVEMFVSARWADQGRAMQLLRWTGCLSIGAMAMRVSWVHLNDLMTSRGQAADVATLGPLAIDALAIMATALILSGRGLAKPPAVLEQPVANPLEPAVPPVTDVADTSDDLFARLAREMADDLAPVPAAPLPEPVQVDSPPVLPPRSGHRKISDPGAATDMVIKGLELGRKVGDIDQAVADWFGVSIRTARRHRESLSARQVSAPPAA